MFYAPFKIPYITPVELLKKHTAKNSFLSHMAWPLFERFPDISSKTISSINCAVCWNTTPCQKWWMVEMSLNYVSLNLYAMTLFKLFVFVCHIFVPSGQIGANEWVSWLNMLETCKIKGYLFVWFFVLWPSKHIKGMSSINPSLPSHFGGFSLLWWLAIRTTVVPIRILIRTTVVPIRILISTTAIISALS